MTWNRAANAHLVASLADAGPRRPRRADDRRLGAHCTPRGALRYALVMSFALIAVAVAVAAFLYLRSRRLGGEAELVRDSTPALDAWIADALEIELAEGALGMRSSTPEERKKLKESLLGNADPDVVSKVEDKVKAIELEFVKYAHDTDAEVTLRVRYEDGNAGTASKRLGWNDVPAAVRADFERRGGTRVFRTWVFPWSRAHAL